jgi:hypothetical protein
MNKVKEELKLIMLEKTKVNDDLKNMKIVAINMKKNIDELNTKSTISEREKSDLKKDYETLKNLKDDEAIDSVKAVDSERGALLEKYQNDNRLYRKEIGE